MYDFGVARRGLSAENWLRLENQNLTSRNCQFPGNCQAYHSGANNNGINSFQKSLVTLLIQFMHLKYAYGNSRGDSLAGKSSPHKRARADDTHSG